MLPAEKSMQRNIRFLREAKFSSKVVISLEAQPGVSTAALIAQTDNLARQFVPPLVDKVTTGVEDINIGAEMSAFLKYTPQLADAQTLNDIQDKLNPDGIEGTVKKVWKRMLTPSAMFMGQFYRIDPFGLSLKTMKNFQQLASSLGYEVNIESGHFVAKDGRHTLMILDTPVTLTDGFASRKLIDYVNAKIKTLPKFVSAQVVAGHLHSLSNEETIKRDISRTSVIATIGFLLIFFLAFRDWRRLVFFIIPFAAVVVATRISSFVFGQLSYFVIGMGAVVIGIADDYAIYVYMAVRTTCRRDIVKEVARPLTLAAFITISVFSALFFSKIEGYRQFSFFAGVSILLCLLFVLFIFPHLLKVDRQPAVKSAPAVVVAKRYDRFILAAWAFAIIFLSAQALKVQFNNDLNSFDGTSRNILQAEDNFHEAWGGKDQPALFVADAVTLREAQRINEQIYFEGVKLAGPEKFISIASVWPSLDTREKNLKSWEQFWQKNKSKQVEELFRKYGPAYKFSDDAFLPFFTTLDRPLSVVDWPQQSKFFEHIEERFFQKTDQGFRLISYFPDTDNLIAGLSRTAQKYPGAFIVSRKVFARDISSSLAKEIVFLAGLSAVLVLFLTLLLLKNLKLTLIALSSVLSSIAAIVGGFVVLGKALNAPAIIAMMVVLGVSIDYGIFILYSYKYKLNIGTPKAVWVSAAGAVIGAVSLLFAHHPVMYSIGLVLTLGLTAGFIAAQIVVPAIYRLWVTHDN